MSRILVGHSYFLRFDPKLWEAMEPYPPLGTLYAAALLREAGHEVHVFDAMLARSTDEWDAMLETVRPDIALLFEDNFNYLSKMCLLKMRDAAFAMLTSARARGCRTISSGADVTDHADEYLAHGAEYAVIGEGDETVVELVEAIVTGGDGASIAGVVQRNGAGIVTSTGRRPVMKELDRLPLPARDLIDMKRYRRAWRRHGRYSANLATSRGCSFHCNWCAKPIWGQRYNARSPESVAEEIATLRALGADHLWFMDDILGINRGWIARLADLLEAHGLQTPFKCLSRADLLLRPGEIEALKRAGCETVWIGAESGSQSVLDAMEKGTTVEQIREVAARLRAAGIRRAFFLQFGYPGETWQDIQATRQMVRDCDPDDIGISVSYPLPGTPFYERVKHTMQGRTNWVHSAEMPMLYAGPYSTAFYRRLYQAVHAEFRLRRATRGKPWLPVAIDLLKQRQPRRALSLIRHRTTLPVFEGLLRWERRRSAHNEAVLPIELTRTAAATPTAQEAESETVAANAQR